MNSVLDALQSCPSLIGRIPDGYVCMRVGNYAWKRLFLLNSINFTLLVLDNHHFFCDLLDSFQLFNLLSHSVLILAESNSSVYSISWGVLIAVVSAATAIFRSNTVTGISNTEVSPP